jgi:hypothetical protein
MVKVLKRSLIKEQRRAERENALRVAARHRNKPRYVKKSIRYYDMNMSTHREVIYVKKQRPPYKYKVPPSHAAFDWLVRKNPLVMPPHLLQYPILVRNLPSSIEARYNYLQSFDPAVTFKPLFLTGAQKAARAALQSHVPRQNVFTTMKAALEADFFKEMRMRRLFRTLLLHYRIRVIDRKPQDGMDPVTFSPIVKPITVYDMKQRRKFVFDASTLVTCIDKNLTLHQYLIPSPKSPINVISNLPFTYAQLLSIEAQLTESRTPHVRLSMYKVQRFAIERWKIYMNQSLRILAIKEELYNYESQLGKEVLGDFILDAMNSVDIPIASPFEDVLRNAIEWYPDHPLFQTMRSLCVRYNESAILKCNIREVLLHMFQTKLLQHYPRDQLWIDVQERMYAEAKAEADEEAAEILHHATLLLNIGSL